MIQLPEFTMGAELLVGGISWSLLVTLMLTAITRYWRPLTEKQIELLKGVFMAGGYVVLVFLTNRPEYTNIVIFILSVVMMFLMSTGIYELSKSRGLPIKSRMKE